MYGLYTKIKYNENMSDDCREGFVLRRPRGAKWGIRAQIAEAVEAQSLKHEAPPARRASLDLCW